MKDAPGGRTKKEGGNHVMVSSFLSYDGYLDDLYFWADSITTSFKERCSLLH